MIGHADVIGNVKVSRQGGPNYGRGHGANVQLMGQARKRFRAKILLPDSRQTPGSKGSQGHCRAGKKFSLAGCVFNCVGGEIDDTDSLASLTRDLKLFHAFLDVHRSSWDGFRVLYDRCVRRA